MVSVNGFAEVASDIERVSNVVSSTVTVASAGALSRKRQRGRPLELGATCLLLGVLPGDTSLIGHEFQFLSRVSRG